MAAEGIVHPIFSLLAIVSEVFASGMQIRCAQELGRGNRNNYCRLASATIYVGTIIAVIITEEQTKR